MFEPSRQRATDFEKVLCPRPRQVEGREQKAGKGSYHATACLKGITGTEKLTDPSETPGETDKTHPVIRMLVLPVVDV